MGPPTTLQTEVGFQSNPPYKKTRKTSIEIWEKRDNLHFNLIIFPSQLSIVLQKLDHIQVQTRVLSPSKGFKFPLRSDPFLRPLPK